MIINKDFFGYKLLIERISVFTSHLYYKLPADKFGRSHEIVSLVAGKLCYASSSIPVSQTMLDVSRMTTWQLKL